VPRTRFLHGPLVSRLFNVPLRACGTIYPHHQFAIGSLDTFIPESPDNILSTPPLVTLDSTDFNINTHRKARRFIMKPRLRPLYAAPALILSTVLAACGSTSSSTAASGAGSDSYIVGAVLPLSGPYASTGKAELQGLKLAISDVNRDGGILHQQVKLVTRDSKSEPTQGALAVKSLVAKQQPDFLIPGTVSNISKAVMPTAMQHHIISAAPLTSFTNGKKYPYFFQVYWTTSQQAQAYFAEIQKRDTSHDPVGILTSNDEAGLSGADHVAHLLKSHNIPLAGRQTFESGSSDVTVQLAKLRAANTHILFVHALGGSDLHTVMSGIRNLKWHDVQVVADASSVSANLQKAVPESVADQLRLVASRIYARPSSPNVKNFLKSLKQAGATTGLEPASLAHDALELVAWATEQAKSTDPDKVRSELESLTRDHSYPAHSMLALPNPRYTKTYHGLSSSGLGQYYATLKVSNEVNGTYLGKPLRFNPS
jgi:branched-chain amino acid transport system substrate-binding protein